MNPQLSGQQEHWRAAMEHNKAVLASQENEMKEYLKRQQVRSCILDDQILFNKKKLICNNFSAWLRSTSSSSALLCLARME